jgi:carboxynorspermidine decarboxylase
MAPLTNTYLSGTCSSGLHEANLAREHYDGEIHVFSAAYSEADLRDLLEFANHIVFNSCSQLLRFETLCREAKSRRKNLEFGLRVNPEHSEAEVGIYDPCASGSRLGVIKTELEKCLRDARFRSAFSLISGLHFHTLCEQGYAPLARTIDAFVAHFSPYFSQLKWVNFGGGHHVTAPDYDIESLVRGIQNFRKAHGLDVYLEPGEAIAIGSGVLVCEVLDLGFNALPQAILDTSATCHMPDTLEMPYRPDIVGGALPDEKAFTYRLGGLTCLAGDVIGDYSFDKPLNIGQRIVFEDMAHYTMVKTTTFNGTKLPSIAIWNSESGELRVVRSFGYDDFARRLS